MVSEDGGGLSIPVLLTTPQKLFLHRLLEHVVDFCRQPVDFGFRRIGRGFCFIGSRIRLVGLLRSLRGISLGGIGVGVGLIGLLQRLVCCALGLGHTVGRGAASQQGSEKNRSAEERKCFGRMCLVHVFAPKLRYWKTPQTRPNCQTSPAHRCVSRLLPLQTTKSNTYKDISLVSNLDKFNPK